MRGIFIALYGINNIGKTTQAKMLSDRLVKDLSQPVKYLKYPLYDLEPTGSLINEYLRKNNPYSLDEKSFQILQFVNKYQYNDKLNFLLESGTNVVAEDYWGTGVAWGIGSGVEKELLVKLTEGLVKEDIAVLLDGERFINAQESNHKHENDAELTNRVRQAHKELANDFGWGIVNANDAIEEVHKNIYNIVANIFTK